VHELDDITGAIVDASVRLHQDLGPGLLESVYEALLAHALEQRGFRVERQKPIRLEYLGKVFEDGFRVDLIVEDRVLVELKSVERLAPVHGKQLLTYLKLTNRRVGLLINFGAATLREGLHRVVNGLPASASPRLRVNNLAGTGVPADAQRAATVVVVGRDGRRGRGWFVRPQKLIWIPVDRIRSDFRSGAVPAAFSAGWLSKRT